MLFLSTQVADVIDDRPEEVKQLESFRVSNKWRVLGGTKRFIKAQTSHTKRTVLVKTNGDYGSGIQATVDS